MRSSHDGVKMKAYSKLLAVMAVLALAVIPLLAVDSSDATVTRQGQWDYSGFTDNDSGRLKVTLVNDAPDAVEIKLMVYETGNHDNVYTTKTVTVPGNGTDEGKLAVELSWKFGSSGTKYVDVWAYNAADDSKIDNPLLNEDNVKIEVSHSIWKNSVTYIVIAIIVIIVIIVLVMYIRSTKKTKADTTMTDKTFTKLHNEKVGKKTAAAEKKEYKSSGNKTRKK
jgi:nitric oxide reductase large subunit